MTRLFWRHFFALLLVFIAVAEWVCLWWLFTAVSGATFPREAHFLGPLVIYVVNRFIVTRRTVQPGAARPLRRIYTGVAFACMFGFVFLLLVGALWGVARAGMEVVAMTGAEPPVEGLARAARNLATGGLTAIALTVAYGYGIGGRRLWVNRFEVPVANLDPRLDGLHVVQISDIHLGPYMSAEAVAGYVDRINALEPDVLVITGDITDGLDHAPRTFSALGALRARLGVFAILGNHDVYTGADQVEEALGRWTEFTVLRDRTTRVEYHGAVLHIIGLDDRGMDWARGVRHCRELDELFAALPPAAPAILLTHRPDLFAHAAALGIPLVLAGHTHGGQIAFPWLRGRAATLAHFMTKYPRGTYRSGASTLHVNLGLGMTGQPIRVASPREITSMTLRGSTPAAPPMRG